MHFTPWPFWLMIVSTATAVLPVLRSPMISSRWPRPTGVMASIDLMPVWSGSFTGWRSMTPGAWISRRRVSSVLMAPLPSMGWPRGLTTRPSRPSPTGTERMRPVALDRLAVLDVAHLAQDDGADRLLVEVQGQAERAALELEQLVDRGVGQAGDAGDAVADLDDPADLLALEAGLVALQVLAQDGGDVVGAEVEVGVVRSADDRSSDAFPSVDRDGGGRCRR